MQLAFKAIRLRAGPTWAVVLTTPEGNDHQIDGFSSAAEAQAWIEGEIGNVAATIGHDGATATKDAA